MHHPFLAYVECFSIHREVYKFFFVGLGGWYSHNVFLSSKTIIHISKSYQNTKILVNVSVTHSALLFYVIPAFGDSRQLPFIRHLQLELDSLVLQFFFVFLYSYDESLQSIVPSYIQFEDKIPFSKNS